MQSASGRKISAQLVCAIVVLSAILSCVQGRPEVLSRKKRVLGGIIRFDPSISKRAYEERTYPPFPEDEDDYDRFLEESNRRTSTYRTTTYRAPTYRTTSEYPTSNETVNDREVDEGLHKRVLPWFKRQWGHTKKFFNRHYDNLSNQLG